MSKVRSLSCHTSRFSLLISQEFLLFPINVNKHWFLAIACYAYKACATAAVSSLSASSASAALAKAKLVPASAARTAADDDDNVDMMDASSASVPAATEDGSASASSGLASTEASASSSADSRNDGKTPCILFLDSIPGSDRGDVAQHIREYLTQVFESTGSSFTSKNMPICHVDVPAQVHFRTASMGALCLRILCRTTPMIAASSCSKTLSASLPSPSRMFGDCSISQRLNLFALSTADARTSAGPDGILGNACCMALHVETSLVQGSHWKEAARHSQTACIVTPGIQLSRQWQQQQQQ